MTLNPNVYRQAAKLVANGDRKFACNAIQAIDLWQANAFAEYFKPEHLSTFWWSYPVTTESQVARSLALLLMAEIVNDENKGVK